MRPLLRASMYFTYGEDARPGVTSPTTFDAVLAGERTATTRLCSWPDYALFRQVRMGDRIRFYSLSNLRGRTVDCVATSDSQRILLRSLSPEAAEEWSRLEGWKPHVARKLGADQEYAVQVRFRVLGADEAARDVLLGVIG